MSGLLKWIFFAVHAACVTTTTSRGTWRTEPVQPRKRKRRWKGGGDINYGTVSAV